MGSSVGLACGVLKVVKVCPLRHKTCNPKDTYVFYSPIESMLGIFLLQAEVAQFCPRTFLQTFYSLHPCCRLQPVFMPHGSSPLCSSVVLQAANRPFVRKVISGQIFTKPNLIAHCLAGTWFVPRMADPVPLYHPANHNNSHLSEIMACHWKPVRPISRNQT